MTSLSKKSSNQIRWNRDLANDLKLRVQATKLTPRKLLEDRDDLPEGLHKDLFIALLGSYNGKVEKSFVDYLYKLCQDEAKVDQFIRSKKRKYSDIPQHKRKQILSERARTGVFVSLLLSSAGTTSIDAVTIMKLANNKQIKGSEKDIDKVLELYALRPTKIVLSQVDYKRLSENYLPIDEQSKIKLLRLRDIGLLPGIIFTLKSNCPSHLNPPIVSNWLNRENQKADPKDVLLVLDLCEDVLKEALDLYK
ncbi:MAG: hypothetical protein ABJF04_16120 [Reichenbachiella sp.]|uniref:hypothetical protein n=1 Tax=Reichenbachiella sp. TaxID=2184521 RepID=UPI00326453AF